MGKIEREKKEVEGEHFTFCDSLDFEVIKTGKKSLDDTFVYLQPTSLRGHEKVNRKRKFFRVVNVDSEKKRNYVIRQLRAVSMEGFKTASNNNEIPLKPITMTYSNCCELDAENEQTIRIDNIKRGDMLSYYWRHPRRDVRMAYVGILLAIGFGVLSSI